MTQDRQPQQLRPVFPGDDPLPSYEELAAQPKHDPKQGDILPVGSGLRQQERNDEPAESREAAHTLQDMVRDGYCLFTPALLRTHGYFDRDPVAEYRALHPDGEPPYAVDCQYPFFQGLGCGQVGPVSVNWDHRLYIIHPEGWPALHGFLSSLSWFDMRRYRFAEVGYYELSICDPTALNAGQVLAELPMIPIMVYCVATLQYTAHIAPAKDPPRTLPYVQLTAPREQTRENAEAVLGPPPLPQKSQRPS